MFLPIDARYARARLAIIVDWQGPAARPAALAQGMAPDAAARRKPVARKRGQATFCFFAGVGGRIRFV